MSREARRKLAQRKAMRNLQGAVVQAWLKLANFPTKFRFRKQPGGTIRNVFEVRTKAFSKSTSYFFEKQSVFAKSHVATTQLLLFVYLRQLTLSPKHKLSVTPCVVLCIALWALKRFTYIAAELFLAGKIRPLIATVPSEISCIVEAA